MPSAEEHLRRWREAGLIDEATHERIREFEVASAAAAPESEHPERPGVVEAILYLGIVVLVVGVGALASQQWPDLRSWSRVAAVGLPAVLGVLVGLGLRTSRVPSMVRAAHVVWMVSVGLIAGTVAVFWNEYDISPGGDERSWVVVLALFTMLVALAFWAIEPSHPQMLAIAGSGFFLTTAVGNWPDEYGPELGGMTLLLLGGAGLLATERGYVEPRLSARPIFAAAMGFGSFIAGSGELFWAEFLVLVVGAGLIALSVRRDSLPFMAIGVVTVFAGLIAFVFRHFAAEIGAPVALIISGALVIAGVLIALQLRGLTRTRKAAA